MTGMKYFSLSKITLLALLTAPLLACSEGSIHSLALSPDDSAQGAEPPVVDPGPETDLEGENPPTTENKFRLDQEVNKFKLRYGVTSASTKLVDNKGQGNEDLYGARNVRVVLHGVMYRGGANNKYLNPPRNNVNPLPTVGLNNLCREDFSTAVYLYSENFSSAPKSVKCKNTSHQDQSLQYKQYAAAGEKEKILALVYDRIKGKLDGPVYAHCWNGWHSSGLISAIALKQFCGWSNSKVDAYWVKNTDGNSSGFTTLRNRIRDFKPLAKYTITAEEKALVCPETY
ncbi:hypothetical protein D3C87_377530 [compost metagenome]